VTWQIPLSDLDYGPEEAAAAHRVLRSKWLSMGPETKAFEEEFAAYVGVRHAIAVANGTAALHLAFLALGLGPGAGIVQPAVNFVASANMTKAVGATPVFADICSLDEPTISPESLGQVFSAINSQPSTARAKAVVVMHYGGYCCRMAEIQALCRDHGLAIIEDACHGVGARTYKEPRVLETTGLKEGESSGPRDHGPPGPRGSQHESPRSGGPDLSVAVGALGEVGCFSFFSNKNLITGEGGMLTTNRDDVAEKARNLRSHGMSTLTWDRHQGHAATYDVLAHGYNYRLDDLRSALGREQLKKLERNNQRRRALTALYWEKLAPLEKRRWVLPFKHIPAFRFQLSATSQHPCTAAHLLAVVAPDITTRWRCAEALKAAGIQTSLHYPLVPGFTAFRETAGASELPASRSFCERVITLPLYPTMTEEQVGAVCEALTAASGSGGCGVDPG
jgi:dTDP-4-amino-4,6-dideoxygalactose transaminase